MIDREEDVTPRPLRFRPHDVEHASERILDERLAAVTPTEHALQLELEAGQSAIVGAGVAEHVRRHGALRVHAPLLAQEADPGEIALLERLRLLRVGLAHDVDEALRLVEQLGVQRVGIDTERLRGGEGHLARARHLPRVHVDGDRLLGDRELDAHPVDDRPPTGRDRHGLVLLARRALAEVCRPHGLQPRRAGERHPEDHQQHEEQQANAAVGRPPRAHYRGRTTYVVWSGEAGVAPSSSAATC